MYRFSLALANGEQLAQGIGSVEDPHLGIGNRLDDLTPPLVDQVGRCNHQTAWVTTVVQCNGCCDTHHGLARAHFAVYHGCRRVVVYQKLRRGMHHVTLGLKRPSQQIVQHRIGTVLLLPTIYRGILFLNGLQQAVTETIDKLAQRKNVLAQFRRCCCNL